ncbi:MAG: lysophospholipid acyltransferase family protein, partial [Isosphaeraceae bacterium]|nr:lysophospholipid acyltransferase family protein [Isosphaeraceae bacterium]
MIATQPSNRPSGRDRSKSAMAWYRVVQWSTTTMLAAFYDIRAGGREHIPREGGALLVSNHVSYLDVFMLGILLDRPLNYVARSTLFFPPLGALIRSVGGFPIQRDGLGASGMKETLRRLRAGGIVALFPEGTRSRTGELDELKAGISLLASRAKTPIIPTAVAGSFEAWPRTRAFPRPHPLHVQFGPVIEADVVAGTGPEEL